MKTFHASNMALNKKTRSFHAHDALSWRGRLSHTHLAMLHHSLALAFIRPLQTPTALNNMWGRHGL